jgi:hypothetical protein
MIACSSSSHCGVDIKFEVFAGVADLSEMIEEEEGVDSRRI